MLLRDATTTQVMSDSSSMDSVPSGELVNAITPPVSLNKIVDLLFVEPDLSLEDSASVRGRSYSNAHRRNQR